MNVRRHRRGGHVSYDISVFRREVRDAVERGADLEAVERAPFEPQQIADFVAALAACGYEPEASTADHREFVKKVAGCPVQVSVFANEVGFSVPYWENSDEAIFTALQDASEICDLDSMAIFDPQTGDWVGDVA